MTTVDIALFASGAAVPETLDSSKVRSNTFTHVHDVGLVEVTRYGKTHGWVASPKLMAEVAEQARELVSFREAARAARPLLLAATRLGIAPSDAFDALMPSEDGRFALARLASLVAEAADNLDAAKIARERLTQPLSDDVSLDDAAALFGVDVAARREAVAAGTSTAVIAAE